MSREVRLLALVQPAVAEAEQSADELVEREREAGRAPSCGRGCGACCRYLVRISVAEALHIQRVVAGLPDDHRARVLTRSAKIRNAAEEAELTEDLEAGLVLTPDDPGQEARMESLSRRYLALDRACPFLEDGACSIYADRPTPCRQYWVTTEAALCADPFKYNVRAVPVWPLVRDRLVRESAEILDEPPRMLPLAFLGS